MPIDRAARSRAHLRGEGGFVAAEADACVLELGPGLKPYARRHAHHLKEYSPLAAAAVCHVARTWSSTLEQYYRYYPGVVRINPSRTYKLLTTRSWDYMGVSGDKSKHPFIPSNHSLWEQGKHGKDVIVGLIDSGIWPESESFRDHGMNKAPKRWKGTSRDETGHGTHTASTAVGRYVKDVSINGLARGTAAGGAPKARLAVYKVCWGNENQCSGADIVAGIDDAVADGVDILSMSLGGGDEEFYDETAQAALYAIAKGVVVVAAAGNTDFTSIHNTAPWFITGRTLTAHGTRKFCPIVSGAQVKAENSTSADR
ncbi:subtilisin-like protease SBT5.3 [Selaginella moellendorffii]|uniref:subtilisin-like protease SBT5.3 n=1 Tax=Selaginella moellendorffii TaxID=88036 RepID=UPI000D1CBB86|nr:subtilisin-like protease SBT5.3 [Selaginella moellendorffii]|eukprot:XP_024530839.1 subtilisin-like protease SBT5.3 [Selaginella moellendorffii]